MTFRKLKPGCAISAIRDKDRRRGLANSLSVRQQMPKCRAKRRSAEGYCNQPVQAEGMRCRYHGGATPKGRDWHKVKPPELNATPKKIAGKRRALHLRASKLKARLDHMTDEERQAYEKHSRAVRPGTASERARAAIDREAKDLIERLLAEKSEPTSDALAEIRRTIGELETALARLNSKSRKDGP